MSRGKSGAIAALTGSPTDRTLFALEVARLCFVARDSTPHPDPIMVCYCLSLPWAQLKSKNVELDTQTAYARFVGFTCELWQLMLFGLLE